jgi:T-complex protein 1 subunit theta
LRSGLHTAEIVTGYQRALEKTFEILPGLVVKTVDNIRDPIQLKEAVKSVLATKQYGYEDLLTELVCNACLTTMSPTAQNPKLNMDSVRISKLRGGTIPQSSVVKVRQNYVTVI